MKVVFLITDIIIGGAERQLFRTVACLRESYGIEADIATDKVDGNDFLNDFLKEHPDVRVCRLPNRKLPAKTLLKWPVRKCAKLLRNVRTVRFLSRLSREYDVVVDYKEAMFFRTLIKVKAPRAAFITFTHIGFARRDSELTETQWKKILGFYSLTVCLTDRFRNAFISKYGKTYASRLCVISNAVDRERIVCLGYKQPERALPVHPYIVMVARFGRDKDQATLMKAFAAIAPVYPSLTLVLAGTGETEQEHRELAYELGIEDRTLFYGAVSNPFPLMKKALFTVMSSPNEGFCLAVAESLCLKTPVVSSDCPDGPPEILGYGKYGLLFRPGDSEDLQKALQ